MISGDDLMDLMFVVCEALEFRTGVTRVMDYEVVYLD